MEDSNKYFFGKILGEIFRLQKYAGLPVDQRDIDGLCEGVEEVVDSFLTERKILTRQQSDHVATVLSQFEDSESKFAELKGFYQIKDELEKGGVDRWTTMRAFRYFKSCGAFTETMNKICRGDSPQEFKGL
jgi:hypothetical protein